jgi:ADP-ribose pyrophosphatase YjhB (NUDIX family)
VASVNNNNDAARISWLAEGNSKQARKRVAAKALIQDSRGHVLLVNPTYKEHWDLPGGMAEANESPTAALAREVSEELALSVTVGRLLTLDWVGAHGPWDDQLVFIFEASASSDVAMRDLRITDDEISDFGFFSPGEARQNLRDDVAARLDRALRALADGRAHYFENSTSEGV